MTKSGVSWTLPAAGVLLTAVMTTAEDPEPKREILQRQDTSSFAFASTLQGEDALRTGEWVLSKDEKYEGQNSWVRVERCDLEGKFSADYGLLLDDSHKHYAVGAPFPKPIANDGKDLVIQYEVQMRNGANCGGAYIKMLRAPAGENMEELKNDSPYSIMFGPDKCFRDTNKVHFIFQHKNPLTLEWDEKHLENAPKIKDDNGYHLYTLHVKADNTFEIYIDAESAVKGNLLEDFKPPVNPPKEIDDPDDTQPDDWVTQKKIPDPSEMKPDDWDEDAPRRIVDESATMPDGWLEDAGVTIPDPESNRPDDWDDEEDGEWEPVMIPNPVCESAPGCGKWEKPLILNPDYKGVWKPTMIDNPDYKGSWVPRKIENPDYYEDLQPSKMAPITGLAVEIWSVDGGVWMDNFVVGDDISAALALAEQTWRPKFEIHEAKAAEEKKLKEEERKEKKKKKDKSNSVLLSTSRSLAGSVRSYLPSSAAPVVDQMAENPLACLGTLLAGLVLVVVLISSSRRRRESSAPRRNAVPASVLPTEPAPEDENTDASKGDGVVEAKEGQEVPEEQAAGASTEGREAAEPRKDVGDNVPEVAEKASAAEGVAPASEPPASGTPTD